MIVMGKWLMVPYNSPLLLIKPLWLHIGLVHNLNDVMIKMEDIYKVFMRHG